MDQYDTQSLYEFLLQTPEGGLRKMLVDRTRFTDIHCTLLLKIARSTAVGDFTNYFEKSDFPRVRMSPAENKIKEKFWGDCVATLVERGILQPKIVKLAA